MGEAGGIELGGGLEVAAGLCGVRDGAGGDRHPGLVGIRRLLEVGLVEAAAPGDGGRGLAAGMGELDAGGGAMLVEEFDDAGEGSDLRVLPEAEIAVGNAGFGRDARGFDDDEAETAEGEAAEMDEVPVVGDAVTGHVLAHRRDDGAVAESEGAEGVGGEEV